jgi:hypothetical protein
VLTNALGKKRKYSEITGYEEREVNQRSSKRPLTPEDVQAME